jgi:phospholipase A-2-activating protein
VLSGHQGFIFCNSVLPSGDFISGSDDKTAKIWRNGDSVDSLPHTNTVWDITSNPAGDIITAGADCFIRVFTRDETRLASVEDRKSYIAECENSDVKDTTAQPISTEGMPLIEDLPEIKGAKQGEIKVFNNQGVPEAYSWHVEGEFWERIGEVVGADEGQTGSAGTAGVSPNYYHGGRLLPEGTYEYVFKVDTGDGIERLLPFNSWENPLEVGEKFIVQEGLTRDSIN